MDDSFRDFMRWLLPICDRCSRELPAGRVPVVLPEPERRLERCDWCGAGTDEGIYVVATLEERYGEQVWITIGEPGRTIASSKTSYREHHPDRVPVFNANLALRAGRVWHGDLDLSVDEPALVAFARRVGQTVYVLHESDGRFEHETDPVLERAVYRVNQEGLHWFDPRDVERDREGILRPRTERRPRRRLVLTLGRPRLWRLWQREIVHREQSTPWGQEMSTLLYLGKRTPERTESSRSPVLVLGSFRRAGQVSWRGIELTWYPAEKRHAPRPLLYLRLRLRRGRYHPYLTLRIHPGLAYALYAGIDRDEVHPA